MKYDKAFELWGKYHHLFDYTSETEYRRLFIAPQRANPLIIHFMESVRNNYDRLEGSTEHMEWARFDHTKQNVCFLYCVLRFNEGSEISNDFLIVKEQDLVHEWWHYSLNSPIENGDKLK